MDDTLLFIPPCCVDKKLPKAVMQAPQRMLTFYTHGDVTMEKFYRAISHLLIDKHVMVLSMPLVTNETASFLSLCFERGWISRLVLSVQTDATKVLGKYLSDYRHMILYVESHDVTSLSSHMVLYNRDRALVLNGPMYDRPKLDARLVCYSLTFYPSHSISSSKQDWGNPLRNALFPDVMRHRQQQFAHGVKRIEDKHFDSFLHLEFPPYEI